MTLIESIDSGEMVLLGTPSSYCRYYERRCREQLEREYRSWTKAPPVSARENYQRTREKTMKNLPDYTPLPPVGEVQDWFDTECSRCRKMYVEEEVDPETRLCVNCVEDFKVRNTDAARRESREETGGTL